MDKKSIDEIIKTLEKGARVVISWDRENGSIKKRCIFDGYHPEKEDFPLFYTANSKIPLNLLEIGYDNLISIEPSLYYKFQNSLKALVHGYEHSTSIKSFE